MDVKEQHGKLFEEIADKMLKQIQNGDLSPGDKLPAERILAQEYGVSRAVIREAFRSMEWMGCVEPRVGGGTFVKTPEISDIADPLSIMFIQDENFDEKLIEVRMILELEIARMAAERITDAQLLEMKHTIQEMQIDLLRGSSNLREHDMKFHSQMADAADNRVLSIMLSICSEVITQTMQITQSMDGVAEKAVEDHRQIYQAIKCKDGYAAKEMMRHHLESAFENLKKAKK